MKTQKKFTTKQAWNVISNAFFRDSKMLITDYSEETSFDFTLTRVGLCFAIERLEELKKINTFQSIQMMNQLAIHKPKNVYDYQFFWPLNKKGSLKRAQLAKKLAKES